MTERKVYLDHAATTPTSEIVLAEMLPYFTEKFGNASSQHAYGRTAVSAVDKARERVAKAIGAKPNEIYFTSGGTESDNWAIKGIADVKSQKGKHIITSAVEHHAVLHTLGQLEKKGFEVTYLPVDETGKVSVADAIAAMREDTILVTIMLANNEVGTLEPVKEIAAEAKKRGITVHTDAVQAVGAIPVDVNDLNVDLLSLSGHKFYGPKGVGVLYVRNGVRLGKLIIGGAQERTMRGGTYNTPGIVGLGKAIELATSNLAERSAKIEKLRDYFVSQVVSRIEYISVNGAPSGKKLPNNANISFQYIEGESILLSLDMAGIAASSGSACSSGSLDPSHVLLAMGLPAEFAHGSIRFTFGEENTKEDADYVVEKLVQTIARLRAFSPLFSQFKGEKSNV